MAEDVFPSIDIDADSDTITVKLPSGDQTQLPTIPEPLRGEDVPSYVLEWIIEADEMGLIIQELLQAPTKSLCRIYRVPTDASTDYEYGTPTVQRSFLGTPSLIYSFDSGFEVTGFDAGTATAPDTLQGLPAGIELPARLAEIVEMAKRLEAWIEKGRRVRDWAEQHGHGGESWLPATSA